MIMFFKGAKLAGCIGPRQTLKIGEKLFQERHGGQSRAVGCFFALFLLGVAIQGIDRAVRLV